MKLAHIEIVSEIMKYAGRLPSQHAQLSPTTSKRLSNGELFVPICNKIVMVGAVHQLKTILIRKKLYY